MSYLDKLQAVLDEAHEKKRRSYVESADSVYWYWAGFQEGLEKAIKLIKRKGF